MTKKTTKRKPVRKSKKQRLSFDEQVMGVEPSVDYFENEKHV